MSVDLTEYFTNLLTSGQDSDFTIVVFDDEGNKVEKKAHKIILKRSPYFEGLFNVEGKEQQSGTVTLDNISDETMALVLVYLYADDQDVPVENAADVMIAADYLQLELLQDECIEILKKNYTELSADEVASSLDKVLKHKLMEPDDCKEMFEYLASNLGEWNNLPYLSQLFLEALIEQLGHLTRQCLYWLENWTEIEHEKVQRIEKAKSLLSKLDLLQLESRSLLECSSSILLSPELVLELLRKIAKDQDDGEAADYYFKFTRDSLVEFEHEGTHWIIAFHAFSISDPTKLATTPLFEFLQGDPDARISASLTGRPKKDNNLISDPLRRGGNLQATQSSIDWLEKVKKDGSFTLSITISSGA